MLGRRHAEASSTASGYTLLINAESAEGNPALTKGSPAPRIRRICTDLWDDVLSGMIIIRGRELKMHEGELRGSDVSRGDFNPGVITFDVIIILCDSASLRLWAFSPSLRTGTHLRVRDWSGIL